MNIHNLKFNLTRETKIQLTISLLVGIIITLTVTLINFSKVYSDNIVSGISEKVIRFHVLANSDTEVDQNLKVYIKDKVLEKYNPMLSAMKTREDTLNFLKDNSKEIENYTNFLIEEQGFDYVATASLEDNISFPTKFYGDIAFPAGKYTAFRIEIGKASGQNWWCVMYPPLCFVDVTQKEISSSYKNTLKDTLSTEEYGIVTSKEDTAPQKIKMKFKIVEFFQN